MSQVLFATDATPALPDLDANFTELYDLYNRFLPGGSNVGVNTASPGVRFDVNGVARASELLLLNAASSGTLGTTPGIYSPASGVLGISTNGAERVRLTDHFIVLLQAAAPSLTVNRQMVFSLTSNTNLRISVRGDDGVTRVANLTLA